MDKATVEQLRAIGLFGGVSDELLEFLSQSTDPVAFTAHHDIFREGDQPTALYVILDGELELLRHVPPDREVSLGSMGPGDWFGEVGILDMKPRSATVRTLSPCVLLPVSLAILGSVYRRDLKTYSLVVLNMAREMCRRMRIIDQRLTDAMAASPPGEVSPTRAGG